MGKNKPRHNPDKPQNQHGNWCQYAEQSQSGEIYCECGYGQGAVCKGNRHNCIKVKYRQAATRSDSQKNEEWTI